MYILRAFGVIFDQIYLFEIMNSNFEVSTENLNVDNDLLIFSSSQSVSVLFIRRE